MAENAVVRTRINSEVKQQATAVLEPMGLTVSDVMRVVLTRVAHERALPFDLNPNKVTRETLRKSARPMACPEVAQGFDEVDHGPAPTHPPKSPA